MATSLLMLSMLLCHCGWLTLPPCHLIVCLLPPCTLIVCLLFLNYCVVYCCFFDCIGRNEVMRLRKKGNDAMIFNASYLNDHYEIWDVGHTVGKVYLRSSQCCIKNIAFFNVCNRPEYRYGSLILYLC